MSAKTKLSKYEWNFCSILFIAFKLRTCSGSYKDTTHYKLCKKDKESKQSIQILTILEHSMNLYRINTDQKSHKTLYKWMLQQITHLFLYLRASDGHRSYYYDTKIMFKDSKNI